MGDDLRPDLAGQALERPEVQAFLEFYIANEKEIAEQALYVELSDEQSPDGGTLDALVEGRAVERSATGFSVRVPKAETARLAARLLAALPVSDLVIEEPPIEWVIEQVFEATSTEVDGG